MNEAVRNSLRSEGKFSTDTTLVVVSCPSCHIKYAIPQSLYNAALAWPTSQSGGGCCPLGHDWSYDPESNEPSDAQTSSAPTQGETP